MSLTRRARDTGGDSDDDDDNGPDFANAPVDIAPRELNISGDADDQLPNTLVITVIQARNLPPAGLLSSLNCYVKLTSMGREFKTSVMTKTEEPVWNETFSFRAVDWASNVALTLRDRTPIKMRLIGQVRISASEVSSTPGMSYQRWFRLLDKNGDKQVGEAEIELKVALKYSTRNDPNVSLETAMRAEHEDATIGIMADQEDETEEEILARQKNLERQERERKSWMYSNLKQGDYQMQVHIIEARDLKGENASACLSGTSDPYCQVEVLGAKKKTSTKYDTLGCVFDEVLFFDFKNIGRNELKQAAIKISVFDKEKVLKDKFIGTYQLDCLSVYYRPNHELYRRWVAIHDHLNNKDRGIQGFLLVTVIMIGPGDAFVVHDREAEIAEELAAGPSAQSSTSLLQGQPWELLPPMIDMTLNFLLVKVFKAEDLPAMDDASFLSSSGIDAYVQIGFAANSACRSSVVTVKGSSNLAPEFLDELWIPVMMPTLSRNISISVWDRDLVTQDELVGISSWDYFQAATSTCPGGTHFVSKPASETKAADDDDQAKVDEEEVEMRWFNLYGPPLHQVNKRRAQFVQQHPDLGSTYRGRVLLSMERVERPAPSEGEKFHSRPMHDQSMDSHTARFPKTVKYVFRCALFCGVDIPHSLSILSTSTKMRVTVSIGPHEIKFEPENVSKDGRVAWEMCKEKWPIILPADLTQLPDVIITLSRQVDKGVFISVSYARYPAADFFAKGFTASKPQWVVLKEEETRRQTKYALEKTQSPGSVLLRIGFGREEVAARHPWGDDAAIFGPFHQNMVHREVRVHIFQFRGLVLQEGRTRAPNPFVSVRCCGQQKKTATQYKTHDPLFYESLVFVVRIPEDLAFSPDILFQVHDANVSSSTNVPSGLLGELRFPMAKSTVSVADARAPRPQWLKLQSIRSQSFTLIEETKGEALVSVQCIDHPGPIEQLTTEPEKITPQYQEAVLEIAALGVRKLKALSVLGVQHPHLEFELCGGMFSDGTAVKKTKPSVSTNGKNANFLDYIVATAKLPVDTLYSPQLNIKVCEYSIGGLRRDVIASCKLNLASKVPWSSEYVPLQQQEAFANPVTEAAFRSKPKRGGDDSKGLVSQPIRGTLKRAFSRKKDEKRGEAIPHGAGDDVPLLDLGTEDVPDSEKGSTPVDKGVGEGDARDDYSNGEDDDDGMGIGVLDVPALSGSRLTATFLDTAGSVRDDPALLAEMRKENERRYHAGKAEILSSRSRDKGQPAGDDDLFESKPPPYMHGRDWWIKEHGGEELEKFLKAKALETYELHRSVLIRPSLLKRKRVRIEMKAGVFKGLIRVTEKKNKAKERSLLDVERLREPQSLVVRIYVLRATNLQSKDANGYSDPYLRLKLGKQVISDRANYKKKTLNPSFFKMFSFNAELPGPSQLDVSVWDHDLLTDDLIGKTTIDLEDRWFHRDWQRIGHGHPKLQEAGGCLKPIENRHLYTDTRSTSQGVVQLWVDILSAQQAALTPAINIDPPEPKKFEVRVIIWRGENITDQDNSEINDYFIKAWMEGGKAEETDVHWRCSNGKPCWNWRMKLPVEYPLRTAEFGRLHLQLWDKDVLKWNDMIGEAQLDLYKWIRRAYERNRSVSPFLELRRSRNAYDVQQPRDGEDEVKAESNEPMSVVAHSDDDDEGSQGVLSGGEADDDDDAEEEPASPVMTPREKDALLKRQKKLDPASARRTAFGAKTPGFREKPSAADLKKTREAKQQAEAKAAINGLLDLLGLGDLPEDAEWIKLYYTDREAAVSMEMGKIGVSVQIVTEQEATGNKVGKGQEAPNVNPYLPPPVGRFRLSANPLAMMKELVGPKMCLRLTILFCCAGCILFMSVFGSTIMSTLTYIQAMSNDRSGSDFEVPPWLQPLNGSYPPGFQLPP